jgi:endonuclease/exonuclease/phosphatase family metal-dependent hydrolase
MAGSPRSPYSFKFVTNKIAWACLVCCLGCEPSDLGPTSDFASGDTLSKRGAPSSERMVSRQRHQSQFLPPRTPDNLLIASFNIQVFGKKKVSDPWIVERLTEIVRQFDIVAIQEIRESDQRLLQVFTDQLNAGGYQYEYILGPRLGRSNSQEQYAFLYDRTRVLSHPHSSYTVDDGKPVGGSQQVGRDGLPDLLHREPLVARFVANRMPQPFTFSLVNIHTDPDEVGAELDVLDDVFISVRNYEYSVNFEDDVILLGDLNQAPGRNSELERIPGLIPLIVGIPTNVRQTKLYDNIFIDRTLTTEFTGNGGVLSMQDFLSLTPQDAERLSDHNPVWGEFRSVESTQEAQLARDAPVPRR